MIFYAPFNMGSLPKNLSLVEDFITTIDEPPGIIAISETKSKEAIYSYFKKCCRGERRMSNVERRLHD